MAAEALSTALAAPAAPLSRLFRELGAASLGRDGTDSALSMELVTALECWAGVCIYWAIWWKTPSAPSGTLLSTACAERLLSAALAVQHLREAILGSGLHGMPAVQRLQLGESLREAIAGLLWVASYRLQPLVPQAESFDWGAWRRCLAHLGGLLQGAGCEMQHPAQQAELQSAGAPFGKVMADLMQEVWPGGFQLAAALMCHGSAEGIMGRMPAEEAVEAAASVVRLAHVSVSAAGC